jgi:hypothetical protein
MSVIKSIFRMFRQLTIAPRPAFMTEPDNFKKYSPEAQAIKIHKAEEKRAKRRERREKHGI